MPRYFSVEEAAKILETTDRTVRRMLSSGRLNGSQTTEKGKLVWRVHASKEILDRLPTAEAIATEESIVDINDASLQTDFAPESKCSEEQERTQDSTWQAKAQTHAGNVAEQFWNEFAGKFLERLEAKDQHIGMLEAELQEKERQLRLLPDLEQKAAADHGCAGCSPNAGANPMWERKRTERGGSAG